MGCNLRSSDGTPVLAPDALAEVPPGKLRIQTFCLEMTGGPAPTPPVAVPPLARIERAVRPTPAFYRFLYETVGGPWLWHVRRRRTDAQIAETVQDQDVDVLVLYVEGQPAGFAELDRRRRGQVELAYLGLMPPFIGQGLGPCLLDAAVRRAWAARPRRLCVDTCTLDHPSALRTYEKAGFAMYDAFWHLIDDPRVGSSVGSYASLQTESPGTLV